MIRRILLVAGALVLVAHAASGAIEDTVERVLTLDFLAQRENVIIVAPHGLGKTMIAKNLVHEASLAAHSARFLTAADLILDLTRQETARALQHRLRSVLSRTGSSLRGLNSL